MKKLPGQPNVILFFDNISIAIPVIFITNDLEKEFFRELFNRFFNVERYLIHIELFIKDPYDGKDEYGQQIYSDKAIEALLSIAKDESIRFKTTTKIKIDKSVKWYNNGEEISSPGSINDVDYGQTQSTIDRFMKHFEIDTKSFRYPCNKLYGKYEF